MDTHEPTEAQERVLRQIINARPDLEFYHERCEMMGKCAWISFKWVDPRPSRNHLLDNGFAGYIMVGPRGGLRCFSISTHDIFGERVARKSGGWRNWHTFFWNVREQDNRRASRVARHVRREANKEVK